MSALKPHLESAELAEFLQARFPAEQVAPVELEGGEVARVYRFQVGEAAYVARFAAADMLDGFQREAFLQPRLREVSIPVIFECGLWQKGSFALSAWSPGQALHLLPPGPTLAQALVDTLDRIHSTSLQGWPEGYGLIGADGRGACASWREHLLRVDEEPESGPLAGWRRLFQDSFLERGPYDSLRGRFDQLLKHAPEERWLVHGDFGFGNILSHQDRVSAVLDWANAVYGDFLYDVARLQFFDTTGRLAVRFGHFYRDRDIPNYAERLRCYFCLFGLESLRFYALVGQRPAYDWALQRVTELLD